MPNSNDYLQFARQCIKWANEAHAPDTREAFLDLAEDWVRAAGASKRQIVQNGNSPSTCWTGMQSPIAEAVHNPAQ